MKRKKSSQPARGRSKRLEQDRVAACSTLGLLDLPPELRTTIWEFAMELPTPQFVDLRHLPQPAITQVCKQLRLETTSLIVPALQNKKWRVPLLMCFHCGEKQEPSNSTRPEYSTFCEHVEDDVRNWTIAPWLETLIEQSTVLLRTSDSVQFYRESIPACGGTKWLDDSYNRHESHLEYNRDSVERYRVYKINKYTCTHQPRPVLSVARVQSLVRVFHVRHFTQCRLASTGLTPIVLGAEETPPNHSRIYSIRYNLGRLPEWANYSEAGQEAKVEMEWERDRGYVRNAAVESGLVSSHRR